MREELQVRQVLQHESAPVPDEVANEVSYALASDNRTNAASIVVDHQDGLIYLRGQVESLAIQRMAETLAASQPGVKAVINGLTIDEAPMYTAGSVFAGVDSPIGPIILAYGRTEDNYDSVYLIVGTSYK